MVHDLEVADGLGREFGATEAGVFVVVVGAVDVERVAGRTKTAGTESAYICCLSLARDGRIGLRNRGRQQGEIQVVAAWDRKLFDAVPIDVGDWRSLRGVECGCLRLHDNVFDRSRQ